jgi:hypothetical protein
MAGWNSHKSLREIADQKERGPASASKSTRRALDGVRWWNNETLLRLALTNRHRSSVEPLRDSLHTYPVEEDGNFAFDFGVYVPH